MIQLSYEIKIRDKGGRPPKDFIKQEIMEIVSRLKRAYPKQVYEEYAKLSKDDGKDISYRTILRYMEKMAGEGSLNSIPITKKRDNPICLYELKMEKEIIQ